MQLTDSDFTRLYTYVKNSYGIDLSKKKQLISSRLNNMLIQQGYRDFTQYTDEIISGKNPEMVSAMLNRLTTNYTYFLREKEHFDFLQKVVLPELAARHAQDHTLSIWSAGCSSGEEPYTISMYLKEFFSSPPWKLGYQDPGHRHFAECTFHRPVSGLYIRIPGRASNGVAEKILYPDRSRPVYGFSFLTAECDLSYL